jgi:hypothetical protein
MECSPYHTIRTYQIITARHTFHKLMQNCASFFPGIFIVRHFNLDFVFQSERGESILTFAVDMTLKSTKALIQPTSMPNDLDFWRSKLLWASRVLPMPLIGLFVITGLCLPVDNQERYPELEALSRLDFGAALKIFLAKQLTSE